MLRRFLLLTALCSTTLLASDGIRATTADGRQVLLRPDGTYIFLSSPAGGTANLPKNATKTLMSKKKFYSLAYDPSKWSEKPSTNDSAEFFLEHESGDVYAMTIVERLTMTPEALRTAVITNAQEVAPDIRIVSEQTRRVNGVDVMNLRLEGNMNGVPITYYGYYWAGQPGTVQIVTFTGQNLFEEYKGDMLELLNGLQLKTK